MYLQETEDLKLAIINIIEKNSGKKLTMEEYEKLDSKKIGELLKITEMSVAIIKRLYYIIVDLNRIRYNRSL